MNSNDLASRNTLNSSPTEVSTKYSKEETNTKARKNSTSSSSMKLMASEATALANTTNCKKYVNHNAVETQNLASPQRRLCSFQQRLSTTNQTTFRICCCSFKTVKTVPSTEYLISKHSFLL